MLCNSKASCHPGVNFLEILNEAVTEGLYADRLMIVVAIIGILAAVALPAIRITPSAQGLGTGARCQRVQDSIAEKAQTDNNGLYHRWLVVYPGGKVDCGDIDNACKITIFGDAT